MSDFFMARVKLSIWYSAVVMLISFTLSGLYYRQTLGIIDHQYGRIEMRLQHDNPFSMNTPMPVRPRAEIFRSELDAVRQQLGTQLLIINGLVFLIGASASYFLSGKTLKPIQLSLQQQKQFVADAAHELRTPITAMKLALEVSLMDKHISKKSQSILEDNLADVTSLESLTNHLLSLAQVERVTRKNFEKVSLNQIVSRAQKHMEPLAKSKHITVIRKDKSEAVVKGDENALLQVFMILLDNAIKFSPNKSTIILKIDIHKHLAIVQVVDQGPGIAPEDVPLIFKRFYKVEKSRHRQKANGYGLGLAVAKKIADQHEANISVQSKANEGSMFTFSMPQA